MKMNKPVILTGLRANNDLHIGNYFGALLPMIDMAKRHAGDYQINLFMPDLHSFTTPIDHRALYTQTMQNLKFFVAAGLELSHPDVFLYRQSRVPAHSELTWILDCFTSYGEMSRMTQFKDKSAKLNEDRISVGLFNYPVLMAADILLYGAAYVPVGDDQTQHLEFTRDIGERLNRQFAAVFPDGLFELPLPVPKQHAFFGKDQGLRIRDLQNPGKKMSKSEATDKGLIFLSDDPEAAARKIMAAETDSLAKIPTSLDYEKQPGISNLLQILALLEQKTIDATINEWAGKTSYGDLKAATADKVKGFLAEFQTRLSQVDTEAVQAKLETSEAAMNQVANQTLERVQRAVGLRPTGHQQKTRLRAGKVAKPVVISFDDFAKLDIRIGKILEAEPVTDSDKLIRLTVDLGNEQRSVVTGMREFYEAGSFVGKQLPIIANLQPQTFKGIKSHGMLMAVEGQKGPVLLLPENDVPPGSPVE